MATVLVSAAPALAGPGAPLTRLQPGLAAPPVSVLLGITAAPAWERAWRPAAAPATLPRRAAGHAGGLQRLRLALLRLAAALLLLSALLVGAVEIAAGQAIHPARQDNARKLALHPYAAITEIVSFPSADGTPLAGWFVPSGHPAAATIILLPGYGEARATMLRHADYLHVAGYNVLLFDFRDTGQSGGTAVTFGMKEPLDVRGAVAYLRGRGDVDPSRIGIQGVSLGASAGLLAMGDDQHIAAAVAESSFSDLSGMIDGDFQRYTRLPPFPFATLTVALMQPRLGGSVDRVRPVDAVAKLGQRPLFIISDGKDQVLPPGAGRHLYSEASGPKEFWLVPGAAHAAAFQAQPDEYTRRVLNFYALHLGGA